MSKCKLFIINLLSCFIFCIAHVELAAVQTTSSAEIALESQAKFYTTQDKQQLGRAIKDSLLQAKESILIFTFSLSDSEIISILNEKASAGIQVTVVIDRDHLAEIQNKKVPTIEVITRTTGEGHLHHKTLVVDKSEIWIGSANFTTSAYESQENVMMRFRSAELSQYLHGEADVFRGNALRAEHSPLPILLADQTLYYCHLPHDGFPPKKIEKSINQQSKKFLIEKMHAAKVSLKIAMMVWTNDDLATAAIQAHQRGVKVQVVAPDFGGNMWTLIFAGIDVVVNPKLSFMHNKLMCVDDSIFINGSANWSQSSFTRNDESFIVVDPMTSQQNEGFQAYWKYLLGR